MNMVLFSRSSSLVREMVDYTKCKLESFITAQKHTHESP